MPYNNMPESMWGKMDKCVEDVMGKGHDKESAIAICHTSLMEGKELLDAMKEYEDAHKATGKEASLSVFKQADGRYRWVAFSSSSYMDREGEIVSQKALEDDTARMNATGQFGVLDWWHTPLVIGKCDFSAMHGHISVESGTFNDEWVGERLAAAKELAASRSFMHPVTEPDAEGVYHKIETFSRAILPRGKESNLLTQVFVSKEESQMLADKIKEFVAKLGGDAAAEAKVTELLAAATDTDKAAEAANIKNKEAAPTAPPAPPEAPAAPDKGWFVADMKPEEFTALLVTAMKSALDPMVAEIKAIKEAQSVATKESGAAIVAEVTKVAATQVDLGKRLAALEGEQPRAAGFRASQDGPVPDQKLKEQTPKADAPFFAKFVANIVGAEGPQPPA